MPRREPAPRHPTPVRSRTRMPTAPRARARHKRRPLVVRGAVSVRTWFPIPLSIRTCGFPAYGLPTVFWTWLRSLGVADGAHELVQALVMEPVWRPPARLAGPEVAAPLHDEQAFEP